jgi:hypothetical protein
LLPLVFAALSPRSISSRIASDSVLNRFAKRWSSTALASSGYDIINGFSFDLDPIDSDLTFGDDDADESDDQGQPTLEKVREQLSDMSDESHRIALVLAGMLRFIAGAAPHRSIYLISVLSNAVSNRQRRGDRRRHFPGAEAGVEQTHVDILAADRCGGGRFGRLLLLAAPMIGYRRAM